MKSPRIKESPQARKKRATEITHRLHKLYPEADCALEHDSALKLLIATILSAQCTDERVNMVTPVLFARYPTARDLAAANQADVEAIIRSTGFFRNKAKNIIGAARVICERFAGEVPATMDELLTLPGVARKTANVLLGTWFKKNEGVVVDTHIGRLAHRLGLSWRSRDDKDAVKIEQDLMEVLPRKEWTFVGHALIWHGRKVCAARKPDCEQCTLADVCPSAFSFDARARDKTSRTKTGKPASQRGVSRKRAANVTRKPLRARTSGKASGKQARR
ncbi:MAG: endonuclease III [Phycisphaerae bacterium]|nr:MAG: endonuclease III [Planctomycetia bacterium]RIK70138.1 MAG: endonuclease III [Planctomycetota bacterium]GJQ26611.1 MAG: endonuclease III [Phycisphaerae bacterium]